MIPFMFRLVPGFVSLAVFVGLVIRDHGGWATLPAALAALLLLQAMPGKGER